MSDAIVSKGVTLTWNGNVVLELEKINGIEITTESVEVTHFNSPDGYNEYIPSGFYDVSDIAIEGNFIASDATGQQAMLADMNTSVKRTAVISFPNGIAAWTFTAFVTAIKVADFAVKEKVPFTATLKVTGKPTLAMSASAGLTTPFFALSDEAVIVPVVSGDVYEYVATVANTVASVTVTPTATAGVITVNGNVVVSGQASSAISLGAAGSITDVTIVVQEAGKIAKTYTVKVVRAS